MSVKAIVGLGNPGLRYVNTRHNVGFCVVDLLAKRAGVFWQDTGILHSALGVIEGAEILLVKPMTYMNKSGKAVCDIVEKFDLPLTDVLVVVDDVHLELGRLRFRRQGSHGGHNGLRSIIDEMGSTDFPRLRMGVGHPPDPSDFIGHVLGRFDIEEQKFVNEAIVKAIEGAVLWVASGIELAMNQFNT